MPIRDTLLDRFAAQLSHPSGAFGRLVGRMLNRGNAPVVTQAVDCALAGRRGDLVVADVGFGGGVGLDLFLERLGADGRIVGVEVSAAMLAQARRRYRDAVASGRVELREAPMDRLPLADGTVDALISTNTVYFIDDLASAFAEVARVLAPEGRAVIGIGDPDAMARLPFTRHRFRLRPVADVIASLGAAGVELADHRRVGEGEGGFHLLVCRRG